MRPLLLSMQAFGPFVGRQDLDFRELAENRLFLITGPTGSGKTSILDAMCFALYGDSSGAERDGKEMRCDLAGADVLTEVSMEFSLGERTLRIRRIPEQERAKKIGEGTTTQKADATLWDRTKAEDNQEGAVLATGWSGVTKAVEEQIGFSSEQFRQVIVLPQGKFRELLIASSKQREEILHQLFETRIYRQIERALKDRALALSREYDRLKEKRTTILEQAEAENEVVLEEHLGRLRAQVGALAKELEKLQARERNAEKELHEGQELRAKFVAEVETKRVVEELAGHAELFETKREVVLNAVRAGSLDDLHRQTQGATKAAEAGRTAHQGAARAYDAASIEDRASHRALAEEQAREADRSALRVKIGDLMRYEGLATGIDEAVARLESTSEVVDSEVRTRTEAHRSVVETKDEKEKLLAEITLSKEKEAKLAGLEQAAKSASEVVEKRRSIESLRGEVTDFSLAQATNQEGLARFEQELADARKARDRLQQAVTDGQAVVLARELVDGEPCAVCGSLEHPNPALGDQEIPSREDLQRARESVDRAQRAHEQAREALNAIQQAWTGARQKLETLSDTLGSAADVPLADLEHARDATEEEWQAALVSIERLPEMERRMAALGEALDEREKALDDADTTVLESQKQLAAAKQAVVERQQAVPEEWRDSAAVRAALEITKDALAKSEQCLEDAQNRHREAVAEKASTRASLEAALEVKDSRERESAERARQWLERLERAGFESEEDFLGARLAEVDRDALEKEIEVYKSKVDEARVRLIDAARAIEGLAPPDLDALGSAESAARAAREHTEEEMTRVRTVAEGKQKSLISLQRVVHDLGKLDEEYAVIGRLADVANGKNPRRISFQRFVLASLLDDVLIAASARLDRMSKGRYRLQRIRAHGDQRSLGGLDLEVEDAYTGKQRSVSSLSGGESFVAALSLALGLAEVVQSYAGGIRLDTIFIDEGFGSLDPDALDLAVNTLVDLQSRGRLVGLISHVPELKERIDVRLELSSNRGASTAAFRLP